jgi:O-antigen ligase
MRYLLAAFFFVMYAGDSIGLNVGLGSGMSIKNLMLYLMIIGIALNAAVARNRSIELLSVISLFVVLILYALMTWITVAFILASPDYDVRGSFIVLKSSLADQFITFLVFFYGILNLKEALWLLRAIIWIAVVGTMITLIDSFDVPNLGIVESRVRDGRFVGFIGSANGYGQFLVLFLAPTIILYLQATGKARKVLAVGVFATALALLLTGSRGAYVGLLAGSLLAAFLLRKVIPTQIVVRAGVFSIGMLGVVVAVAIAAGYADVFLDRFERFGGSSHVATSGRSTIWTTAIKAMIENPLSFVTGYGFNAYISSRSFYAATHNVYLTYLYDLGCIGLFLYVAIFARIIGTAKATIANAPDDLKRYFLAAIFGLCGFMVSIFFSEYHASGYLLWAYLGVVMRLALLARNSEPAVSMEGRVDNLSRSTPRRGSELINVRNAGS